MPPPAHTYESKCRLAPVTEPPPPEDEESYPPLPAQFFYSSLIPIDDPLSPGTIAGATDNKSAKGRLRPFSLGDNNALAKAWLGLMSEDDRRSHREARQRRKPSPPLARRTYARRALLVQTVARKHWKKHGEGHQPQDIALPADMELDAVTPLPTCCADLSLDVEEEFRNEFCALLRKGDPTLSTESVLQDAMMELRRLRLSVANVGQSRPKSGSLSSTKSSGEADRPAALPLPHLTRDTDEAAIPRSRTDSLSRTNETSSRSATPSGVPIPPRHSVMDDGISGKPFIRVGTPDNPIVSLPSSIPQNESGIVPIRKDDEVRAEVLSGDATEPDPAKEEAMESIADVTKAAVDVTVGISRLHMVSLPALLMKPIYWSPVNDVAVVMRATWFYRDSMLPVDPKVANQLEAGYRELRPYTETWQDELRCAIDVGPLGEEKVSHPLWPADGQESTRDEYGLTDAAISTDPFCAARCFRGEAAVEGSTEALHIARATTAPNSTTHRSFANYHVIYKDDKTAFLLKPSLRPSAYYGRRPVAKIMKGVVLGIPVVRGFDRSAWERLHEHSAPAKSSAPASAASQSRESTGQGVCPACKAERERGQVTDLVLVAHGIGQKFAERVESFHFTHAVNGFRRAINVELKNDVVRTILRPGQNGIMVLPINWRHTLSFEDGGPRQGEPNATTAASGGFSLKDIEPNTIPAVRSMISDIMFDVPFYMSHHKSKMIESLVAEANRVYRLWCRNNPGFSDNGRVHLLGHSLGSAMAIEILSKQPNRVPRLDLSGPAPQTQFFEFDTKNLFLVGSPAAFFLLLERGALLPRRGRLKPGAEPGDTMANGIVGDEGQFGCLAVDNIYNVMAREDPIAYFLNGTIDPDYAASLKTAYVPSTTTSFFKSVGDAMLSVIPGMAPSKSTPGSAPAKPPTARLPSQLELEVHDFSREELAETKAHLLNDNGQIDYFLHSGSGPFEIQYLNMLSAHSCYWTNQDFIRMLCMEIGRKPGRAHTLPALRAVKRTKRVSAD